MFWTIIFVVLTVTLYLLHPYLGLKAIQKVLALSLFLQLFYLIGHYIWEWPFPTPLTIIQITVVVGLGVGLGVMFSKIWPLTPKPGFERVLRTLLIVIPSIGLGVGLQVLFQGGNATQAIYMIFALAAWLGSGHFMRRE